MDELPPLAQYIFSPGYARLTSSLALACLAGALAVTLLAFAQYRRAREGSASVEAPWVLLIATWRDSLIITLLFVAEALAYRASQFATAAERGLDSWLLALPAVEPVISFLLMVLIFAVALLRIRALSAWLRTARE